MPRLSDYIPKIEGGGIEGDYISNYTWRPFDNQSQFTNGNILWKLSGFIHKYIDHLMHTSKYYQNTSETVLIGPARKGIVIVTSFATYAHIENAKLYNIAFISDQFKIEKQKTIANTLKTSPRYKGILKKSINIPLPPRTISSKWLVDTSRLLLSKVNADKSTALVAYTPIGIAIASCMCLLLHKENGKNSKFSIVDIKNNGENKLEFSPEVPNSYEIILINSEVNKDAVTGLLDPKCHHAILDDSVRNARSLLDVSLLLRRKGVEKKKISSIVLFNHCEYGPVQAFNMNGIPIFSMTSTKAFSGSELGNNKSTKEKS